jgi:hypothetical protein
MKTIALIDTRTEVEGKIVGTVISTPATMLDAFKANDAFQRDSGGGVHIRTKILTLKEPLRAGEYVKPAQVAGSPEQP